jgi:hypothetical protein
MYQDVKDDGLNGPHFNVTSVADRQATTWPLQRGIATSAATVSSAPFFTTASNTQSDDSLSIPTTINSTNDNKGLSIGATAGVAIGAIAGSILLVALAFTIWRNKRRVHKHSDVHGDELVQVGAPPNYECKDTYQHRAASELEPQATVELEPRTAPQELQGSIVDLGRERRESQSQIEGVVGQ